MKEHPKTHCTNSTLALHKHIVKHYIFVLHCIVLHYILYYITLHVLHYITCITLHYMYYITLHVWHSIAPRKNKHQETHSHTHSTRRTLEIEGNNKMNQQQASALIIFCDLCSALIFSSSSNLIFNFSPPCSSNVYYFMPLCTSLFLTF